MAAVLGRCDCVLDSGLLGCEGGREGGRGVALSSGCHGNPVISFPPATSPITFIHESISSIYYFISLRAFRFCLDLPGAREVFIGALM